MIPKILKNILFIGFFIKSLRPQTKVVNIGTKQAKPIDCNIKSDAIAPKLPKKFRGTSLPAVFMEESFAE